MTSLVDKVVAVSRSLSAAGLPHALGGALALGWCTTRPRGTADVDVNVFVPTERTEDALAGLPEDVASSVRDRQALREEGQARLWWERTPVDVFLSTTAFHDAAAGRAVLHRFAGVDLPFLACDDLAVFKAFFNRTKDWADLEDMHAAGTVDLAVVRSVLVEHLGADDVRLARLDALGERRP